MEVHKRLKVNLFFLSLAFCIVLLFSTCLTPSILVIREQNRGDALFNEHKYPEAINHYEQMLEASRKLGIYRNSSMESEVYRKIANGYEMMGRYESAMFNVNQAIAIDSIDNNLLNRIEDYRHEGKIYVYMGYFYYGITSLEKSLKLSEGMDQSLKNTSRLSIADTYLALGQLYAVMGRSENAMEFTGKALSIFKQAGTVRGEMESYLTIGTVYTDQGDIVSARKYIENSLNIAEEGKMGTARHNQLLATISVSLGEYEKALRYQEKSVNEARKYGIVAQIIWATVGMGDIYRELGDLNRAERYYKDAKEAKDTSSMTAGSIEASLGLRLGDVSGANRYFSSEGSLTGKAISALRMAEIMMKKTKRDSALILLGQAGQSFSSAGNIQGLSNVRLMKGKLFIDNGEPGKAGEILDSSMSATEFPETIWQVYFQKGRMFELMDQDAKAIESYRNAISVIEKTRGNLTIDEFKSTFFDSKREVYDRLINILLRNNKEIEAFQFSEQARARAFYDILANKKIDFKGSLPGDLISMEQEKRIEMQKLYKLLQRGEAGSSENDGSRKADITQVRNALARAQTEYEELIRKIKLNNPSYAEIVTAEPVNVTDLRSRLDPKTAVLAYWISDKELILWLITHSGVTGKKVSIDQKSITDLVERARISIRSNSLTETAATLSQLYQILIAPVEDGLGQYSNLVIIPNGSLHFLPFQALINKKNEYLVQKFNLIYSPSASVYIVCNDRLVKTGSKFMGMALSDIIVDDKAGLPGTEDELKKILPLFPENISAFGMNSTETFVKKNAGNYNFIHFATHGSYNYKQPLYSYLLFPSSEDDDGKLNVYEVFELDLNAKLVTLSACETGLGNVSEGDEITGLSRAFLFAGSSSVIVSLWAVADYPTSLLMTNFYGYLKDHPMQEALTLAQRDVIKVFPQPLYWSPFILIGNGNVSAN
jgi:CHAT domain-containing protein/predicted negative regulator of RcsB-dependent stress response